MSAKAYKDVPYKTTAHNAYEDGKSELESLGEEMREWADNLEAGNLGHTEKYEQVNSAADEIENAVSNLPEAPDWLEEIGEVEFSQSVSRRKGRAPSRAVRRDNAVASLRAAFEAVSAKASELGEKDDDPESEEGSETKERIQEMEEFASEIESACDEADGAEFPGMY